MLRSQRAAVQQQADAAARFFSALLSVKLEGASHAVQMIAQSPAFDGRMDLVRFRTLAGRIIAIQPDWHRVTVADLAGNRLVNVPEMEGRREARRVVEIPSFRRVIRDRIPVIGDVARGPDNYVAFAVRAPVLQAGQVRYVVSAVIPAERLRVLLRSQPLPVDWSAAILDARGQAVTQVGDARSAALADARVLETRAPVAGTPWTILIRTPARDLVRPQRSAILLLAMAAVLSLLLLFVLVRLLVAELHQVRDSQAARLKAQRMEALGQLTGGVAHDFNNLLTPIIGNLDLIARRTDDARITRYVQAASASAERAKSLVSRLLAFSRRQSLSPRPVDLGDLLAGMSDLIAHSVPSAIQVSIDLDDGLPLVYADSSQLELAILNLIINARDAMPDGGQLRVTARPAAGEDVAGLPPGDYVSLRVIDTGTGMSETTLKRAIDPFFTTKPGDKGTGLGLSMVHGFAGQSGGVLRIASTLGRGTVMTIVLPHSREPAPAVVQDTEIPDIPPGRILLVDDDAAVRTATAEMLRQADQTVIEADGVGAALMILAGDQAIDAIVTDFRMPGRSGADLIRIVRAERPGLPILLVTGYVTAGAEIPTQVPRLMKPFSAAELIAALARARSARG
ncbi:MAG TPA: ATP-binding protein [Sphingomonas sp.]|uniref:ATP-binding protein n=1 Tax=Sphingomonas sp. TaxID=28214 RepID=UPI002EDA4B3A